MLIFIFIAFPRTWSNRKQKLIIYFPNNFSLSISSLIMLEQNSKTSERKSAVGELMPTLFEEFEVFEELVLKVT